jgi:hypothetical protein
MYQLRVGVKTVICVHISSLRDTGTTSKDRILESQSEKSIPMLVWASYSHLTGRDMFQINQYEISVGVTIGCSVAKA